MRLSRSAALAVVLLSVWAGVASAPEYVAVDAHPAGADSSQTFGMNAAGEAVGSTTRAGVTRAAYWASPDAAPVELDGFGGTLTRAFEINSGGELVGLANDTGGVLRAIYWPRFDAAPVQLGDAGFTARANAINDRGEIVGNVAVGTAANLQPAYWPSADAPPAFLATLGDTGGTADINNRGRIVGTARDTSVDPPVTRPVFWTSAAAEPRIVPGVNSGALPNGINDRGHVVGRNVVSAGVFEPVFWQWSPPDGEYAPAVGLGSLAADGRGEPVEISEAGEIVGWSGPASAAQATLWRVRAVFSRGEPAATVEPPLALPGLGGTFARPQALNNAGAIAGESASAGGATHATFWLTH